MTLHPDNRIHLRIIHLRIHFRIIHLQYQQSKVEVKHLQVSS